MRDFLIALMECSVTMSALALAFIGLTPWLSKRYDAGWLYYVWLVIVVGLIIPFRLYPDAALIRMSVPPSYIQQVVPGNAVDAVGPAVQAGAARQALPAIPWHRPVGGLWIAGVAVFTAYHGWKHYRFTRMLKRWGERVSDPRMPEALQKLKSDMEISKPVKLQVCSFVSSPMMIGFLNPVILLPRSDYSADELSCILKHELVHLKRRDLWYKSLVFLATAIHWFNPAVYLMAKAVAAQCEISCDAEAVKGADMDGRRQYGEIMIGVIGKQSGLQTEFSTNFHGGREGMKKRIFFIMDMTKKKAGILVLCLILIGAMATGVIFAVNKNAIDEQGGPPAGTLNSAQDITGNGTEAATGQNPEGNTGTDPGTETDSGTDGLDFQAVTDKFAKAYLAGDVEAMKSCLSDPDSGKNDFSMEGRPVDDASLTLKLDPQKIKENTASVEYEILPAGRDSFDYLYLELEKINGEWKVKFYGLEK